MTLPASGSISLSQVNTELGYSSSAQISLNDSAVRTLFDKSSGAISMSNGYGKANTFSGTISSNQTNLNLRTWALANGWNGTTSATVTISSGVYVSSNSAGTPALTISGSFPGGITLVNNGYIVGAGGTGGAGANISSAVSSLPAGSAGSSGGLALSVSSAVSITNNGTIAGGGGGGGGGGASWAAQGFWKDTVILGFGGGGGGGGRAGASNSSGGNGGVSSISSGYPVTNYNGAAGNPGTSSSAGSGGTASSWYGGGSQSGYYSYGGAGGAGGSWATSGSTGGQSVKRTTTTVYGSGGSGGGAGGAVTGNSNITWVATGTRYGSIS